MAKNLEIAYLLDFYGDMLTEKQRNAIDLYYNDDLSLAEIAQAADISRQGVRDNIKRAEQILTELEEKLKKAEAELDKSFGKMKDINTMYVRLQADFDNYKKRTAEQLKNARGEGIADAMMKVIPIADVIGNALKMITDEKVAEGVNMINRQLNDTLAAFGVEELQALGKPFDPALHNAILRVPAEKPEMSGCVIEVFQKGYRMGDKILRHSVVKVAE